MFIVNIVSELGILLSPIQVERFWSNSRYAFHRATFGLLSWLAINEFNQ
jgi:hypothetical protein